MRKGEGKSNYSKIEFKFKKGSIDLIPTKPLHVPAGRSTAFDCKMVKNPPHFIDGPVIEKMKSQREECSPQTLTVELVKGYIHINVKKHWSMRFILV